jgi:uracil-DNA glycosylase family 4
VKYSQDLNQVICPNKNKTCKACGLYLNQLPLFDNKKHADVFWVGLSAVQINEDEDWQPLAPGTRSGALIESIEFPFLEEGSFYKTNLVKCLPLKNDKIRYPLGHEMEKCYPNFNDELERMQPSVVFLLGKQVASFVMKKLGVDDIQLDEQFDFETYTVNNITFIPVHHPSYILVYKRKLLMNYTI